MFEQYVKYATIGEKQLFTKNAFIKLTNNTEFTYYHTGERP